MASEGTEPTDIEKKIIRQIEYYFGDMNLPKDRFLQEQLKLDDGWVTLETMTKFNRLKHLTIDTDEIAAALEKSTSGLLQVHGDNTKVRRNPEKPMPENTEEQRQSTSARTVYAKEFPLDNTLDDIQEFFETFGPVENVFLRKDEKKEFKGSVFVVFKNKDDCDKFLTDETVKYKDTELESRKLKTEYYKMKNDEKKKLMEEKDKKKGKAQQRQEADGQKKFENTMVTGAMLHMTGFADGTTREDIKNMLQDFGPIAWVDFNKGDKEAWIRYDQENKGKEVLEQLTKAMGEDIKLNDAKLEADVLEGEAETARWKKMFEDIKERRDSSRRKNQWGGGRGGRGGQGGGMSRNQQKGRYGHRPSKNTRDRLKREAGEGKSGAANGDGGSAAKKAKVEGGGD